MRKNKFRAWDREEKRFWYFDLQKVLERQLSYMGSWDRKIAIGEKSQYTGLKDRNGVEIYEGDIVKVEDYFGKDLIGKVIYDVSSACYYIMEGNERNHFMMTFDYLEDCVHEVIGNIYENKDMLGE